jgi:hypothetical protein
MIMKLIWLKYLITAHCKENGRTFKFTVQRIKEFVYSILKVEFYFYIYSKTS